MRNYLAIAAVAILPFLAPISGETAEMKAPAQSVKSKATGLELELKKAHAAAEGLSSAQKVKLLDLLNKGSEKELTAIKGIAAGKTKAIIAQRPYLAVEEVVKVKGIGLATFTRVVDHGKNPPSPKTPAKS